MKETMTIRLPDNLRKELYKISEEEEIPVSDLMRESLKQFVSLYHFRKLRAKTLPYAEAKGFFSDEDVFRAVS